MPRAEVGSTKHLANKMKSKGLQRLRWYCQVCEKQCRDANGFKCHVQSESHVRQMQVVGEDPRKFIENFSRDFHHDFIQLLRTAHGEKYVNANRFYQEYISHKEHIHMNATKWPSLTEYVKYLGREGICHVKEDDKGGLQIAWRDLSPEALRRREAIKAADALESKNEAGEDRMLKKMVARAKLEAEAKAKVAEAKAAEAKAVETKTESPTAADSAAEASKPEDGLKLEAAPVAPVKVSFGLKAKALPGKTVASNKTSIFKRIRDQEKEQKAAKKVKV
ncbi:hypothetical protein GQ43DRAFT_450862 [Delitschia confertaspora ATCC 74209]|uniref:C2H2-type domain-containing protein n=1 Tax=Delitschia confertaspora ATCC 74209 TaxID=1513339 RepID=A0A9P4JGC3_9PLEO|nr:hypothetical protein GQ43DRAFT_450862 [Delitschia confertaspora ATCC 74209]